MCSLAGELNHVQTTLLQAVRTLPVLITLLKSAVATVHTLDAVDQPQPTVIHDGSGVFAPYAAPPASVSVGGIQQLHGQHSKLLLQLGAVAATVTTLGAQFVGDVAGAVASSSSSGTSTSAAVLPGAFTGDVQAE